MEAAERRRLNQQDEDKLQRQFDWSQKMDNAERVRRQKQWRKMEVMEKLEVSKERLNALKVWMGCVAVGSQSIALNRPSFLPSCCCCCRTCKKLLRMSARSEGNR